jgi:hypothetical protein
VKNRNDFIRLQQRLQDAGLAIDEAEYWQTLFGSWHVTVKTNPRRRVMWDGKEGWLLLQEETEGALVG